MVNHINLNDSVFVPRTLLGLDPNGPSPFYSTIVRDKLDRSVRVDLPSGDQSAWIGTSKISKKLGVLILRIGDYEENLLLDPLFKSVLQFCRILLPDDHVFAKEVRTLQELTYFWHTHHAAFQQLIFIGHGAPNSIRFGDADVVAHQLVDIMQEVDATPKEIISLCCQTGQAPFAKAFSAATFCADFLAPYHSVHGCIASQFCQNYMTLRLLNGQTIGPAFNRTRKNLIGAVSFRRWHNGAMKSGQR